MATQPNEIRRTTEPQPESTSKPVLGLLTKKEAAAWLRVSTRTLDAWMKFRVVGFIKIGRTVRFRLPDLESTLQARTIRSN